MKTDCKFKMLHHIKMLKPNNVKKKRKKNPSLLTFLKWWSVSGLLSHISVIRHTAVSNTPGNNTQRCQGFQYPTLPSSDTPLSSAHLETTHKGVRAFNIPHFHHQTHCCHQHTWKQHRVSGLLKHTWKQHTQEKQMLRWLTLVQNWRKSVSDVHYIQTSPQCILCLIFLMCVATMHHLNDSGSVQFSSLTNWVVRGTQGTIQQRSSPGFSGQESKNNLQFMILTYLWFWNKTSLKTDLSKFAWL